MERGAARDPDLVCRDERHAGPPNTLGLLGELRVQPGGLAYQEKVLLPLLLPEQAHALAELLCKGLVLDVVQHELRIGHQRIPLGLQQGRFCFSTVLIIQASNGPLRVLLT